MKRLRSFWKAEKSTFWIVSIPHKLEWMLKCIACLPQSDRRKLANWNDIIFKLEKLFSIHVQESKILSTEENIVNTAALLMTSTPETIQMSIDGRMEK